jgi:hypothetical protein
MTNDDQYRTTRFVGIGCLMTFLGAISGAMTAVLVSMVVAFYMKAPGCSGLPSCNWHVYAGYGALIGALTLPVLVLNRMRQPARDTHNNE